MSRNSTITARLRNSGHAAPRQEWHWPLRSYLPLETAAGTGRGGEFLGRAPVASFVEILAAAVGSLPLIIFVGITAETANIRNCATR